MRIMYFMHADFSTWIAWTSGLHSAETGTLGWGSRDVARPGRILHRSVGPSASRENSYMNIQLA